MHMIAKWILGLGCITILSLNFIEIPTAGTIKKVEQTEHKRSYIEILHPVTASPIVYDNMTLEELSAKLDRSLNSTIQGKGTLIASYTLEQGVDPYLAVAILLHETGCKWECSSLVQKCNNVGGQKGYPSCGSGGYQRFDSLDEGIMSFIDNLKYNYIDQGLTTPVSMERRYTGKSTGTWSTKIESYIESIRNQ